LQREDDAADIYVRSWSDELAVDGYVHANLARHCVYCGDGRKKNLTALLLDFRWTERQLKVSGMIRLTYDFVLLCRAIGV
jgi:hypothetical protein